MRFGHRLRTRESSGCSGSPSSPASPLMNPHALRAAPFVAPQADLQNGIYVAEYYGSTISGYKARNKHNAPPVCTVPFTASYVNDVASDDAGNLIDPDGGTHSIIIGRGPDLCGPMAATIADPYGQPADASSLDALHGRIAVANVFDNGSSPGSISVCSVAKGCTSNLTNRAMYEVVAVAMDKTGDCWASAIAAYPSFTPTLGRSDLFAGFATCHPEPVEGRRYMHAAMLVVQFSHEHERAVVVSRHGF